MSSGRSDVLLKSPASAEKNARSKTPDVTSLLKMSPRKTERLRLYAIFTPSWPVSFSFKIGHRKNITHQCSRRSRLGSLTIEITHRITFYARKVFDLSLIIDPAGNGCEEIKIITKV